MTQVIPLVNTIRTLLLAVTAGHVKAAPDGRAAVGALLGLVANDKHKAELMISQVLLSMVLQTRVRAEY